MIFSCIYLVVCTCKPHILAHLYPSHNDNTCDIQQGHILQENTPYQRPLNKFQTKYQHNLSDYYTPIENALRNCRFHCLQRLTLLSARGAVWVDKWDMFLVFTLLTAMATPIRATQLSIITLIIRWTFLATNTNSTGCWTC